MSTLRKNHIHSFIQLAIGFVTVCLSHAAFGQTQKPSAQWLYDRALASTCVQCHSNVRQNTNQPNIPSLTGYNQSIIIEQMQAFKNGTRPATIMHQIAKGYSDAEIERIAEVLSTGLWDKTRPTAVHSTKQP